MSTTPNDNEGRTCDIVIDVRDGATCGKPAIAECCLGYVCTEHGALAALAGLKPRAPKTSKSECAEGQEKKLQEGELRLCPFCQCDPVHLEVEQYTDKEWYIKCNVCGTCGPNCETKEIAVGYWNNRAKPTAQDAPAVIPLEHLRMAYDRLVAALEDDGLAEKIADRQIGAWDNAINAYRAAVRERIEHGH